MYKFAFVTLAAATCLLVVSGKLEVKESKLACERLSNEVVPTEYQLELQFPSFRGEIYYGQVNISLRFPNRRSESSSTSYQELVKALKGEKCEFGKSSDTIILHADPNVTLLDVEVITESCGWGCIKFGDRKREVVSVERDTEKQLIAIKLKGGVSAGGSGQMSIKFWSKFSDNKRGVYVSHFDDGYTAYKHIVSQFQPTDARTVFPVFDEPRFKVPFQVRLVHPAGLTALSNTEVESVLPAEGIPDFTDREVTRTTFKRTPPMAVHMVAFTVGQFDEPLEIEAKSTVTDKTYKVRVFTEPGKRESGRFALEVAQGALEHFERYIDYEFPLDKFDVVAIADHDKDNTESWGLAFIRNSLVWIDEETKLDTRITTAVNVAHVCVHQWFANLVTASWWNDLWITEGVAAQFAFNIVRELYPQFQSEYFVRLATLSGVMVLDRAGAQHALRPKHDELRTSAHIYEIFDNIEFMKSASLAQMVDNWMGTQRDDWYRKFLQLLVSRFAFKSVTRRDYLVTMQNSLTDSLGKIEIELLVKMIKTIDSFGSIHGVPMINVQLVEDRLSLDVELLHSGRYALSGPTFNQLEPIKVFDDVRVGYEDDDESKYTREYLPNSVGLDSDHTWTLTDRHIKWAKVSSKPNIHTYYRTRYSENIYQALSEPIRTRTLSAMDRLQILDDANILVQSNLIHRFTFKRLVDAYENEDNGAVLIQLMLALQTLANLPDHLTSPSSKAVLRIYESQGFTATGSETFLEQRSRSVALKALIAQGNQQVILAAMKAYDANQGNVALFLREAVYNGVVKGGLVAQVKQLEDKLHATKSYEEKIRLVTALTMSSDKEVLHNLWAWLRRSSGLGLDIILPFIKTIVSKL